MADEQVELDVRFRGYRIEGGRTEARIDFDDDDHVKVLDKLLRGFHERHGRGDIHDYEMRVIPRYSAEFVHVKG